MNVIYKKKKIYVAFTMDCERIAPESPVGGPADWALSSRAIQGFCELLCQYDIQPTLFLQPECARHNKKLLCQLADNGVELGMHMHPQAFGDHRYKKYLGEYTAKEQKKILEEGIGVFETALGTRPKSFRPGNFSASNDTFSVLADLGFTQGSVSDPGRNIPEYASIWQDAYPYIHYANAKNKLLPGALPFLEIPLTTDPPNFYKGGFPCELRIEFGSFSRYHRPIFENTIKRLNDIDLCCLCIFTHNYFEYSDPECEQSITLSKMCEYFDRLKSKYDIVGINLLNLRKEFKELSGKEKA